MSYSGFVVKVKDIKPIEGADKLNTCRVFDSTVVVDKTINENDLYIYFPTDGQLSKEYCEYNNLLRKKDENGNNIGGFLDPDKRNVKAIKLRGERSDGLVMPLSSLDYISKDLKDILVVGDQITVLDGKEICRKYNCTLFVTHHLNKSNGIMGSVGLTADASGIMKLKESKNNCNKLTLDYKGRDFSRLELNLKRNENQTFSVIDENTDDETDYNLLLFIKYAVARKDFDYTISEILSKTNILLTPTQLGGLIQRNLSLLEKEGLHITSKRTANERLWHCSYEEPSENNE